MVSVMPNGDEWGTQEWWEKKYPGRGAELYKYYQERLKYYQERVEPEKAYEGLIPRPEQPVPELEKPVSTEAPSWGLPAVTGKWAPYVEEREPLTPREFAISREFPVWLGGVRTPTEAAEAMVGAPALGFEEFVAKPFAATILSPFYEIEGEPAWKKLLVSRTADAFPEGKAREAYEEWKAPWGLKGTIELLAWFALPVGAKKPVPIFKEAGKILQKIARGHGKGLSRAEHRILGDAEKLAKKENREFAEFLAEKKPVEAKMPTIQELIEANYNPNVAARVGQKLTRIPGPLGSLSRALLPMQAVKTDAEKAAIAWAGLTKDTAPNLARIEMNAVYINDSPFKFAPALYKKGTIPITPIETGLVENVTPKLLKHKPQINAIMEFPDRYILNKAQRAEVDLLDDILRAQFARETAAGVKVYPTKLKPGQRYFPRVITELQDLETKALTEIRRGLGRRPGIRPGSFRDRYYQEVIDGIAAGKRYSTDYRGAVDMRLTTGNKAIADKQFGDFLAPMGKIPTERMDLAVKSRYWGATRQYVGIRHFQAVVNRAIRGEKIPEATLLAQERRFPELGLALRQAGSDKKLLRPLITKAKALKPALQREYWAAKRLAAKELRIARRPILGKEGVINHAALQGRIFPIELSEPTNALIAGQITPHQVLNQLAKISDTARMGQTAIDWGPGFIQGQLLLFNHPRSWAKMWEISLKTLWNVKYRARYSLANRAVELEMATHGTAPFGGSEFTMASRPGGWLGQIPITGKGFRRFGAYFEALIDTGRTEIFKAKKPFYTAKLGRKLNRAEITDLVVSSDHMMGVSSMARLGIGNFEQVLARNVLYAPRYFLSFVSFLGRAFQGGIGGDIARKALVRWLFGSACFMSAVAVGLGQEERIIPTKDKPIPTMFDPTSGEFYTVEIGGAHIGLGGVWVAGMRLLASLSRSAIDNPKDFISIDPHENPVLRYGYGRASPVLGGAIDLITGHNYLGERVTDTPMDYIHLMIDKTFPFWLAGAITDVPKSGFGKGFAEWWGLRAWMIQYREQAQRYAEDHIKDIPSEMIMPWQQDRLTTGDPLRYEDLNNEQRAWLLTTFEDYREAEEKRKEQRLEKGTNFQVGDIIVREMIKEAYDAEIRDLAEGVMVGKNSIKDYNDQSEELRRAYYGTGYRLYRTEMEKILDPDRFEDLERWIEENQKPEDVAYDKYGEIRGNPPKTDGVPDWDKWREQIEGFLLTLDPETRAYIERRQDDWINNLPENAQKVQRLIDDCETVLDRYYGLPQGKARIVYREAFPEVDARLCILGRIGIPKTQEAARIANDLYHSYIGMAFPWELKIK